MQHPYQAAWLRAIADAHREAALRCAARHARAHQHTATRPGRPSAGIWCVLAARLVNGVAPALRGAHGAVVEARVRAQAPLRRDRQHATPPVDGAAICRSNQCCTHALCCASASRHGAHATEVRRAPMRWRRAWSHKRSAAALHTTATPTHLTSPPWLPSRSSAAPSRRRSRRSTTSRKASSSPPSSQLAPEHRARPRIRRSSCRARSSVRALGLSSRVRVRSRRQISRRPRDARTAQPHVPTNKQGQCWCDVRAACRHAQGVAGGSHGQRAPERRRPPRALPHGRHGSAPPDGACAAQHHAAPVPLRLGPHAQQGLAGRAHALPAAVRGAAARRRRERGRPGAGAGVQHARRRATRG